MSTVSTNDYIKITGFFFPKPQNGKNKKNKVCGKKNQQWGKQVEETIYTRGQNCW